MTGNFFLKNVPLCFGTMYAIECDEITAEPRVYLVCLRDGFVTM